MLETDTNVRSILEQSQILKGQAAIALTGHTFQLGDFMVRLARPGRRSGEELLHKLVLIDVEYLPVSILDVAAPILTVWHIYVLACCWTQWDACCYTHGSMNCHYHW